jgi:hypothetical protein
MIRIVQEELTDKNIREFVQLSKCEYGEQPTTSNLDHIYWKHINSPYGPSTSINLYSDDKLVGRAVLQPRSFKNGNKIITAAFVNDVLIHPDFRRPATNFFMLMKELDSLTSYKIILHTANETTEELYKNALHFHMPFKLDGYGAAVHPIRCLKKKIASIFRCFSIFDYVFTNIIKLVYRITSLIVHLWIRTGLPDRRTFDEFCENNEHEGPLKNWEFYEWRFLKSPLWPATIMSIYEKEKFSGFIITRSVEIDSIKTLVIMDYKIDNDLSRLKLFCIRLYLMVNAIKVNTDAIFTLKNSNLIRKKDLLGFPICKVPERFLPHSTPIFIKTYDSDMKSLRENKLFNVNLADLDYF